MTKILQVNKHYFPVIGGIETVIQNLAEGLSQKPEIDMEVLVCHTGPAKTEVINGVMVHRSRSWATILSMPFSLDFFLKFRRLAGQADVIMLHHPFPLGFLAYLIFSRNTPLIVCYHSDIIRQKFTGWLFQPFLRATLRQAKRIFVTGRRMIENSPILRSYENKCAIVPYGFPLDHFKSAETAKQEAAHLRQQYPGPLVLSIGRLVYYKGFEYLIEAMAGVSATLLIVGSGPLQATLEQIITRLNLAAKVKIIPPVPDLIPYYFAADVFVLPSVAPSEAFGIVQVEALAAGLPVVNTDLPTTVPEVSVSGQTGLTVPPRDSEALAQALQTLVADPELRLRLGQAGRVLAHSKYSLETFVARTWQEIKMFQ